MSPRKRKFGNIWYTEIEPGHWRKTARILYRGLFVPIDENGNPDRSRSVKCEDITSIEMLGLTHYTEDAEHFDRKLTKDLELTFSIDVLEQDFERTMRNERPEHSMHA